MGSLLGALLLLVSVVAVTCDQQDFVTLNPDLVVTTEGEVPVTLAESETLFFNGLYRLALDFTLTNPSAQATEVVVYAITAVREAENIERVVGERGKVFALDAGASRSERFSDLDLKAGTTLGVQLQCCSASFCAPSAVDCPASLSGEVSGKCAVDASICDKGCFVNGIYDLPCIIGCMSFYSRCCPEEDFALSEVEVPCCLETCAAQRCIAGQVACAAATDCSTFPTTCLEGCPGRDAFGLDARCVASCMNIHAACCGDSAPTSPDEQIPCCFEDGCDQLSRPEGQRTYCPASSTACAPQDACDDPNVCLSSCGNPAGGVNLGCVGACMRQFNRCCGSGDLPPFPTAEVPCCFEPCAQGSGRCPISDFVCPRTPFRCDAYPTTCVSGCLNATGAPDLSCVFACFLLYEGCCDFSIPIDPNQQIPCCFSTHCSASMRGLVNLSSIECRSDAECGTGQFCNDRNLCESTVQDSQGSCSTSPRRAHPLTPVFVVLLSLFVLCVGLLRIARRRQKMCTHTCTHTCTHLTQGDTVTHTQLNTRARPYTRLTLSLRHRQTPAHPPAHTTLAPPHTPSPLSRALIALIITTSTLTASLSPSPYALADEPIGFHRLRTTMAVGLSLSDWILGDLGAYTQLGMGVVLQQSLQYSYWGFGARISIAYHLSSQPPLPFDRGFDAYHLAAGPRLYIPLTETFELTLQPEYLFQGLGSNTLIQYTHNNSTLHGVGLWTGLHILLGTLIAEAALQSDYLPQTNTLILSGVLSIGIQGLL